jgi:hypothetical protein
MDFTVEHMTINFTSHQPRREDTIIADGTFGLPEGVSCDLDTDDVMLNIDGVVISIPAGSFKAAGRRSKWGWGWWGHPTRYEKYHYTTNQHGRPKIDMWLDFDRGTWSVSIIDVDASAVDSYDGVSVELMIGELLGEETIDMRINSLSYSGR